MRTLPRYNRLKIAWGLDSMYAQCLWPKVLIFARRVNINYLTRTSCRWLCPRSTRNWGYIYTWRNQANCLVVLRRVNEAVFWLLHTASIPHEYRTCAVTKCVWNADDACSDYGIPALQFMLIYMRDGLQRNVQRHSQPFYLSLTFLYGCVCVYRFIYTLFS